MTSIVDLRRTFFGGGTDEEIAALVAATNAGITFADTLRAAAIAPKPLQSGRYYFLPNYGTTTASGALTTGSLRMTPFLVPNAVTLDRIGGEITIIGDVGSKLRIGIYEDDGTGRPGDLILDAGTIAGDSATVQQITINQALDPGIYWIGGAVQTVTVTQPTVRIHSTQGVSVVSVDNGTSIPTSGAGVLGFSQVGVTGALPSAISSWGLITTAPRIFARVA